MHGCRLSHDSVFYSLCISFIILGPGQQHSIVLEGGYIRTYMCIQYVLYMVS